MKFRDLAVSFVAILLLSLMGCANPAFQSSITDDAVVSRRITSPVVVDPLTGVQHEVGVLGPGALYEIWMPPTAVPPGVPLAPWNHCLVLYAHGYTNPLSPVGLSNDTEGMRQILVANGYAVAQSSFSENGWAIKDGAIRTRQLRDYFANAYGAPLKVYLVGASEGAMIAILLAEKNPELFSGALCIGGPLGGATMEVKYIYNVRILFERFFGDELDALVAAGLPQATALREALGTGAMDAHPTGSPYIPEDSAAFAGVMVPLLVQLFAMTPEDGPEALLMATTTVNDDPVFNWPDASPVNLSFVPELAATIAGALWYNIHATEDMLDRTHDHIPIDTTGDTYAVPGLGELTDVERLVSRPDASNYLAHWYQTTGRLSIPLVILHTTRDPIVPSTHATRYAELAAASGSSDFLKEVDLVPAFGHCQILVPPEYLPDVVAFGARLLRDFSILLFWTGMPPLVTP